MDRLEPVLAELETARARATAAFAAEADMPVKAFLRHFRILTETGGEDGADITFRVEPISD